jgi:hypothetical protein
MCQCTLWGLRFCLLLFWIIHASSTETHVLDLKQLPRFEYSLLYLFTHTLHPVMAIHWIITGIISKEMHVLKTAWQYWMLRSYRYKLYHLIHTDPEAYYYTRELFCSHCSALRSQRKSFQSNRSAFCSNCFKKSIGSLIVIQNSQSR